MKFCRYLKGSSTVVACVFLLGLGSCKKKEVSIDLTQYYIAGKFTVQQGPPLPFAFIFKTASKGQFVFSGDLAEVDYTFENKKLRTKVNGANLSCDIKNGKIENIEVESAFIDIAVATLSKQRDSNLSLTGKRFEAPLKNLDSGANIYDNFYFQFDTDPGRLFYTSRPVGGNYIITSKSYELLADGCIYNGDTDTFGVVIGGKLELETKLGTSYVLFSGSLK